MFSIASSTRYNTYSPSVSGTILSATNIENNIPHKNTFLYSAIHKELRRFANQLLMLDNPKEEKLNDLINQIISSYKERGIEDVEENEKEFFIALFQLLAPALHEILQKGPESRAYLKTSNDHLSLFLIIIDSNITLCKVLGAKGKSLAMKPLMVLMKNEHWVYFINAYQSGHTIPRHIYYTGPSFFVQYPAPILTYRQSQLLGNQALSQPFNKPSGAPQSLTSTELSDPEVKNRRASQVISQIPTPTADRTTPILTKAIHSLTNNSISPEQVDAQNRENACKLVGTNKYNPSISAEENILSGFKNKTLNDNLSETILLTNMVFSGEGMPCFCSFSPNVKITNSFWRCPGSILLFSQGKITVDVPGASVAAKGLDAYGIANGAETTVYLINGAGGHSINGGKLENQTW